jgi:hypothetical protein
MIITKISFEYMYSLLTFIDTKTLRVVNFKLFFMIEVVNIFFMREVVNIKLFCTQLFNMYRYNY